MPLRSPAFNYEKLQHISSFGSRYSSSITLITSKSCFMKKALMLLLLFMAINLPAFAAAKYKPAFYDRAMAAIHTPMPGEVAQAPLPPINVALEMHAGDPERRWRRQLSPTDKANMGLGLIVGGALCLAPGIYFLAKYYKGDDVDIFDLDAMFLNVLGVLLTGGGLGMLIPGIVLRLRYGPQARS
jgi:hypothetical protein